MRSKSVGWEAEGCGRKMPKNSKNSLSSRKGNPFDLLDESVGDESITIQSTSTRERPLKRTQPDEPNSPPHAKRANSTKFTTSQVELILDTSESPSYTS